MAELKTIKIFLASSIVEFEHERRDLDLYITRLNKEYIPRGIMFDLEVCENVSNALSATRKQDEYNDIIRSSRYFYVIVGERMGQFTEEEFDVALEQFQRTGTPLIYTYFKQMPEGQRDQSALAFMERIGDGLSHYWNEFTNLDSIKLNIILELMRDPEVGGVVQFEDGRALLNGEEMVSLENVPIYSGNDNLQAVKEELAQVEEKRAEVQAAIAQSALSGAVDPDAAGEFAQLSTRREELLGQIHQMEMSMLENLNSMVSKSRSAEEIDPRERKAAELTNAGKYDEANAVLSDKAWAAEIEAAAEVAEGLREKVRQYVSGQQALLANLESMGITKESEGSIKAIYDRASKLALEWHVCADAVADYAQFLYRQRCYDESISLATKLGSMAEFASVPPSVTAKAYTVLGHIFLIRKRYGQSIEAHNTAIRLLEDIASEGSEEELTLANAYIALSETLWSAKENLEEAKRPLVPALEILHRREDESKLDLGYAYNMYGLIERALGNLGKGIELMERSIEYRAEVAQSGKQRHLSALAISYNNMAYALNVAKRYEEAEKYYRLSLEIRETLARENPSAYATALAKSNLAASLINTSQFDEAYDLASQAVEERRQEVASDPAAYSKRLAGALRVKAHVIHQAGWQDRFGEAEACFSEAYAIYQDLNCDNPLPHQVLYGTICRRYARFCADMGDTKRASTLFSEALEAHRAHCERNNGAGRDTYSQTLYSYAEFLFEEGELEKAEVLAHEALEIRQQLYKAHPDVYEQEYNEAKRLYDEIISEQD